MSAVERPAPAASPGRSRRSKAAPAPPAGVEPKAELRILETRVYRGPNLYALRKVMRENGDAKAELWATEAGATTCTEGVDERCVDAETQARWIREYVELSREMPWLVKRHWWPYGSVISSVSPARSVASFSTRKARPANAANMTTIPACTT